MSDVGRPPPALPLTILKKRRQPQDVAVGGVGRPPPQPPAPPPDLPPPPKRRKRTACPWWKDDSNKWTRTLPSVSAHHRPRPEKLRTKSWFTISTKAYPEAKEPPEHELWTQPDIKAHTDVAREKINSDRQERMRKNRHEKKDENGEVLPPPEAARKVYIKPDKEGKKTCREWANATRWTYNQCVAYYNAKESEYRANLAAYEANPNLPEPEREKIDATSLRQMFVNDTAFYITKTIPVPHMKRFLWVLKVPSAVRADTVNDFIKARASNLAKNSERAKRNEPAIAFEFKFRTRKDMHQTIPIRHDAFTRARNPDKTRRTAYDWLIKAEDRHDPFPKQVRNDMRLTLTKTGHMYLIFPTQAKKRKLASPLKGHKIIALDPGVRTFQTGYSADGEVVDIAAGDHTRIRRLQGHMDDLASRIKKERDKRKKGRMIKAKLRMHKRIRNLVDDVHIKAAVWLVNNYRVVLLPTFRSGEMVKRKSRKIGRKTARAMMSWGQARFRDTLLQKASESDWCDVILCKEDFTSQCCSECGQLHTGLGANKVFLCPNCGVTMDRDANGARNILIYWLSSHCQHEPEVTSDASGVAGFGHVK